METTEAEFVRTEATIESLSDLIAVKFGLRPPSEVRRLDITDAVVGNRATLVSIPTTLIRRLGLQWVASVRVDNRGGPTETGKFEPVRLTIQGRTCTMDVLEVPNTMPVMIGRIPLERLDLVVDPRSGRLIDLPAYDGERIYKLS